RLQDHVLRTRPRQHTRKRGLLVRQLSFVLRQAHTRFARRILTDNRQEDGAQSEKPDARLATTTRASQRFQQPRCERSAQYAAILTQRVSECHHCCRSRKRLKIAWGDECVSERLG